jgi:hypothetical protein
MTAAARFLLCWAALSADPAPTVDGILAQAWSEAGIEPAGLVSDGEYLRRITLDLAGRIPTVDEQSAFLNAADRQAKVDELLSTPDFARFWSEIWTAALVGYETAGNSNRESLRLWLEQAFAENRPFEEVATDLIASTGVSSVNGPVNFVLNHSVDPAIKVSRTFLGIRIDCARCHDHPFDRWTQADYQGMNRYFAATRYEAASNANVRVKDDPLAANGDKPRYLTGGQPVTSQWRLELAFRITRDPAFHRSFANRVWYVLMGRGIVDPPDDFTRENQPSVPLLLDELAAESRRTGGDLRALIRRIAGADAYRRSSSSTSTGQLRLELERQFAVRGIKPLTPEQLVDSAAVALGDPAIGRARGVWIRSMVGRSLGEDFSTTWTYRETIQDLMSRMTLEVHAPEVEVDKLYARLLCRPPTAEERSACEGHSPDEITSALLNSHEFSFNH